MATGPPPGVLGKPPPGPPVGGVAPGPVAAAARCASEPLHLSWKNHEVRPNLLRADNIMDYFAHPSNPFYDQQCDNEFVRMQRGHPSMLLTMPGVQYECVRACEPLFVVRKHVRQSADRVRPIAFYYVINGVVYQAPDLASVLNSRLVASLHHLRQAFNMTSGAVRYTRERGYTWHLPSDENPVAAAIRQSESERAKDEKAAGAGGADYPEKAGGRAERSAAERSTAYQRTRTDAVLATVARLFPVDEAPRDDPAEAERSDGGGAAPQRQTAGAGGKAPSSAKAGVKRPAGDKADGDGDKRPTKR